MSTIDLSLQWPDPDPKRTAKRTRDALIAEGRAAYRSGVPECPPFKDADMAINWRLGWRWEQEAASPAEAAEARRRGIRLRSTTHRWKASR